MNCVVVLHFNNVWVWVQTSTLVELGTANVLQHPIFLLRSFKLRAGPELLGLDRFFFSIPKLRDSICDCCFAVVFVSEILLRMDTAGVVVVEDGAPSPSTTSNSLSTSRVVVSPHIVDVHALRAKLDELSEANRGLSFTPPSFLPSCPSPFSSSSRVPGKGGRGTVRNNAEAAPTVAPSGDSAGPNMAGIFLTYESAQCVPACQSSIS